VLRQPQFAPRALGEQVALLFAVAEGTLDDIRLDRVDAFCAGLGAWLSQHCREALAIDDETTRLSEDLQGRLKAALKELARSVAGPPAGDES